MTKSSRLTLPAAMSMLALTSFRRGSWVSMADTSAAQIAARSSSLHYAIKKVARPRMSGVKR